MLEGISFDVKSYAPAATLGCGVAAGVLGARSLIPLAGCKTTSVAFQIMGNESKAKEWSKAGDDYVKGLARDFTAIAGLLAITLVAANVEPGSNTHILGLELEQEEESKNQEVGALDKFMDVMNFIPDTIISGLYKVRALSFPLLVGGAIYFADPEQTGRRLEKFGLDTFYYNVRDLIKHRFARDGVFQNEY